jgi:UDP-N-acetylmuramoyl-tripeptide--D-alanyl-D-alanine ligase
MRYHLRERHYRLWLFCGWVASVLAYLWRRLLFRTTFVAVTGSLGKTTTKECLGAILCSRFPTVMTFDTQNGRFFVPRTILRARPWHRFVVLEIATETPGWIWKESRRVRPDVAVILSVARTHTQSFPTLDDIAAEKARLLDALRPGGTAVLSGDDPRVLAMASRCRGRVLTFGRSPEFDLWASEVSSRWPSRLSFTMHWGSESRRVSARLVGEHWVTTALASLTVALCCGMDLKSAVSALEQVEPYRARLEPVPLPSGAIMLRDDFSGSVDSLSPALRVIEQAEAQRRLVVLSGVSDTGRRARDRIRDLGYEAARVADSAVFVGEHSYRAAKAALRAGMRAESVHHFPTLPEAAEFLKSDLREGDLALLRGPILDHLARVYFAQLGSVACAKTRCPRQLLCDHCEELRPGFERAGAVPAPLRPFWQPL